MRTLYKRARKTGLPPGSPVHIGAIGEGGFTVKQVIYSENDFKERDVAIAGLSAHELGVRGAEHRAWAVSDQAKPELSVWIQVSGIQNTEAVGKACATIGLHPLIVEDIVNTEQRVKLEDYPDSLYLIIKLLSWDGNERQVVLSQMSVVVKNNVLYTFLEWADREYFNPIVDRIRNKHGNVCGKNIGYLLYVLIDFAVDNYFSTVESLEGEIDTIEEETSASTDKDTISAINTLRRELLVVKKLVWSTRDILLKLERGNYSFIGKDDYLFYRDIQDHILYIIDTMDTFREIITGLVDVYLSKLSNRMNEVIKMLTMISTIFMPMSFLAGLYGMNFQRMPGIAKVWGMPVMLVVMGILAFVMVRFFKRRKWL